MRDTVTSTVEDGARARRRRLVLAAVLLLVLALLGWAVVEHRAAPQVQGAGTTGTADSRATIHVVSFAQSDTSYLVESVDAVVQGGEGFLRLRVRWTDDPDDPGSEQAVPALSATVTHAQPYAGMTATCGTDVAVARGPESTAEVRLPCQGLLVPEDVATVELRD